MRSTTLAADCFRAMIVRGYAEPRASQCLRDGGADNPRGARH